ncbi:XkdW family protein [Clostridium niameyense]|uniref:XkdW family protein n=1 Tax=Clostridium niameyense TaxID=1622073 RepID=UPI00067E7A96|nr:XkdW family protein [Clostridium niameyense]
MKQYIKGDHIIVEFDNGSKFQYLQSEKSEDAIKDIVENTPPNPILELQKQVNTLGQELAQAKVENIKKDNIINTLGQELAQIKIQLVGGDQ